jgi:parallel beta-helix repeat protein
MMAEPKMSIRDKLGNIYFFSRSPKHFYNVKKWGAEGDKRTDDTDLIQRLFNSITGSTVYFPPGVYMVRYNGYSAYVSLYLARSGVTVRLDDNAEIKMITNDSDYYSILNVSGAEDISIIGGTFTGDRATHTGVTGQYGYGIHLWNCKNVLIDGVLCQECWGDGIFIDGDDETTSQNVTVQNSTSNHNRRQGITVCDLNGGLVDNCILTNQDGSSPMGGIDFEPYMTGQVAENITVSGCTITGNTGAGFIAAGTEAGVTVSDITVDGNTITGNDNNAFYIDTASGFIIENNIASGSTQGIRCITCDGFTIEYNTVSACSNSGINLDTLSHDCTAQKNSCTGITGSSGIQIGGGSFDNTATNNTLTGNLFDGVGTGGAGAGNVTDPNSPRHFHPDAHVETSSVDGIVQRNTAGTWAQIIAGAGTNADDTSTTGPGARATANVDEFERCWRSIFVFDTSILPVGAVIDSAELYFHVDSKVNDLVWTNAMAALCLVSATPATHTALVAADYGTLGSTRLATDVPYNVVAVGDNTITLNAAGLAVIHTGAGAVSEFGLRIAGDLDASAVPWVISKNTYYDIICAEAADATIPKLTITYHVP